MPDPGERISATVDRISNSGNGMVELEDGQELNLGPIKPDAVGQEVEVEILSGNFARCLIESVVDDYYYEKIGLRSSNDPVTVPVGKVTESGYGVVELGQEYLNIGPVSCSAGETVDIELLQKAYAKCVSKEVRGDGYRSWVKRVTEDMGGFVIPVTVTDRNEEGDSISSINKFQINLGPLDCQPGDVVDVEVLKSPERMDYTLGYTLSQELRRTDYQERMQSLLREFIFDVLGSTGSDNVVEARIDRISGEFKSYDGIVEYQGREYNIGPIRQDSIDESVEIITIGNNRAACLDKDAWGTDKFGRSNIAWIIRQMEGAAHTSDEVVSITGFVGARRLPFDDKVSQSDIDHREVSEVESIMSTVEDNGSQVVKKISSDSTESSQSRAEAASSNWTEESSQELAKLRARAEQAASEDPGRDVETSPGSRYARSSEIKEYAKVRANGYCEGCEKESPFTSKQGEPYLEVHHVYELGEGGSDTPSSVIALCPTCHSRVHYAKDGDKYNEELREKVENELAEMGQ